MLGAQKNVYPVQPPPPSSLQPHSQAGYPYGPPNVPPGYYGTPPPARRTSPVVWVLAAMGLMAVLGGLLGTCGVVAGLVALGASSNGQDGVVMGAQVPKTTKDALVTKKLLRPDETLLAYHDETVSLDMSEVTFITSTRVVHAKGQTVTQMNLADVTKVTHSTEGILGDVVEIAADDSRMMRVEIAPLNGGDSYVNVLEDAWKQFHPTAKVVHVTKK